MKNHFLRDDQVGKPIREDDNEAEPPVRSSEIVRPTEYPNTLADWLWRLKLYEDGIFVRWKDTTGHWRTVSLVSLPPKDWAKRVARWLEEGAIPARIRDDAEPPNDKLTDAATR